MVRVLTAGDGLMCGYFWDIKALLVDVEESPNVQE